LDFVVVWRLIAQRAAASLVIVARVFVLACSGLFLCGVLFPAQAFEFERVPERFHRAVVVAVGSASHAGDRFDFAQFFPVHIARVFAPLVAVDAQAVVWFSLALRHREGLQHQRGVNFFAHSPVDLMAAALVLDGAVVQPAFAGFDVGDFGAPDLGWPGGCGLVLEVIGRDGGLLVAVDGFDFVSRCVCGWEQVYPAFGVRLGSGAFLCAVAAVVGGDDIGGEFSVFEAVGATGTSSAAHSEVIL